LAAPSTALVHDYLLVMRGAERAFVAIGECWPSAPIFTLLYDAEGTNGTFDARSVRTSYLQRLPVRQSGFRLMLPLFPRAAERLPVSEYDLVVSSTSAFAHGVRPRPGATHVAYCYTPLRYAWHERERGLAEAPRALRPALGRILTRVRAWDLAAAQRVTHYIAISELSRRRIQDFYGRDATVVHPPVDVDRFAIGEPEDFFLVVSELVAHKRVDNALAAARRASRPIKVVGAGPELNRLRHEYGDRATFLGRLSDAELTDLAPRAIALVVPNVEEFGIAAVEAQAAGRPVLAADAGGACETVLPGRTGVLVAPEDVDALAEAMAETDWSNFDPQAIRRHAQRFSTAAFKERFAARVAQLAGVELPRGAEGVEPQPEGEDRP
jgi:glycosyltransferase involved in cell wall biosynthesis